MYFKKGAPISKPKLLLGEGADNAMFFTALLDHLKISDVQVEEYGGKQSLHSSLRSFVKRPDFQQVVSLAVTRDADYPDDPTIDEIEATPRAFQSICSALQQAKLPVPMAPKTKASGTPEISIYILPGCQNPGMLEDVCLNSVHQDARFECIENYFDCIEKKTNRKQIRRNISKSRISAWLSTQPEPDKRLGQAAVSGYWDFDHPAFDDLKNFLQQL